MEMTPIEEEYLDADFARKPRPEAVLLMIALLSAALFIVTILISIPYFGKGKDPEFSLQNPTSHFSGDEAEENPEETEIYIPEETTEPTIPPEPNPYTARDFQYDRHNFLLCQRQDSYPGVDVSFYQHDIDWQQVAASGIRFAMIRLGIRGYGAAGKLVEDEYAKQNLKGAKEAGLALGAYFFSQATNIEEVDAEIEFFLKTLGDTELTMPIVLDWECNGDDYRTVNVDRRTLTDMQLHFCRTMEAKGFKPMIYFNKRLASKMLYLNELEDYPFWLAFYSDRMDYPFRVEMWQYTESGNIPGINTPVDINVYIPDFRFQNG